MRQSELRLWIILNILSISREHILCLELNTASSNDALLQYTPTTNEVLKYRETYDNANIPTDKEYINNYNIRTNLNDALKGGLSESETDYEGNAGKQSENIITQKEANSPIMDVSQTEYREVPVIANYQVDNVTSVYIAGIDDSIMELKKNIQKFRQGRELCVHFYLYKDRKYYDLGYLYTDAYTLIQLITMYNSYFCVDISKNEWCFNNLLNKRANITLNARAEDINKYKMKPDLSRPIPFESSNVFKLTEYLPKQLDGHYEFNIPNESKYKSKDITLHIYQNSEFDKQNINANNIALQSSISIPTALKSLPSKNNKNENNIGYSKIISSQFEKNKKLSNKDFSTIREPAKKRDDIIETTNDINSDENNGNFIIEKDKENSLNTIEINRNGFTKDKDLFEINQSDVKNNDPINTLLEVNSNFYGLSFPSSIKSSVMEVTDNHHHPQNVEISMKSGGNNYQLTKLNAYEENPIQKELIDKLQYDAGTQKLKNVHKKGNTDFHYHIVSPNVHMDSNIAGTKGIPIKIIPLTSKHNYENGFPYYTQFIPYTKNNNVNILDRFAVAANNEDGVTTNEDDANFEAKIGIHANNIVMLSRPTVTEEEKLNTDVQSYSFESKIKPAPTSHEEDFMNENITESVPLFQLETYPMIHYDDKTNYKPFNKFNLYTNKNPGHIHAPVNGYYRWQAVPSNYLGEQMVYSELKNDVTSNNEQLINTLPAKEVKSNSLSIEKQSRKDNPNTSLPCTTGIDNVKESKEFFHIPSQAQLFLNNMKTDLPRTEYFIQDPCAYKNLKSFDSNENSQSENYAQVYKFQNNGIQSMNENPYNYHITKGTLEDNTFLHINPLSSDDCRLLEEDVKYVSPNIIDQNKAQIYPPLAQTNFNYSEKISQAQVDPTYYNINQSTPEYSVPLANIKVAHQEANFPKHYHSYGIINSELRKPSLSGLIFNKRLGKAYENTLLPAANSVIRQGSIYPFNILPQYTQNYLKIPSGSAYTAMTTNITPSNSFQYQGVLPSLPHLLKTKEKTEPPIPHIPHDIPYLYSNIKNVAQLFTSSVNSNSQDKTNIISTIIKSVPSNNGIPGIPQKSIVLKPSSYVDVQPSYLSFHSLTQAPENLESIVNPVEEVEQNKDHEKDSTARVEEMLIDESHTKPLTSAIYHRFPYINVDKSLKLTPKTSILRDYQYITNIMENPTKMNTFATSQNYINPEKVDIQPFTDLQGKTTPIDFQSKTVPQTHILLNNGPDSANSNDYLDLTYQPQNVAYNLNVQNSKLYPRTTISPNMAYSITPNKNILISKLHNIQPTSYLPLTATSQAISIPGEYISNFTTLSEAIFTEKNYSHIPEQLPKRFNTNTLAETKEEKVKSLKRPNITESHNKNIQSRLRETTSGAKFSSKIQNVPNYTIFKESNKLGGKKADIQMIHSKVIPEGNTYNIYNYPALNIGRKTNRNQGKPFSDVNFYKSEDIPQNVAISQDHSYKFDNLPGYKQNYIEMPVGSTNLPETSRYLQYHHHHGKSIPSLPSKATSFVLQTKDTKEPLVSYLPYNPDNPYLNIKNVVYPFTVKTSLSNEQDVITPITAISENILSGHKSQERHQENSNLKILPDIESNYLRSPSNLFLSEKGNPVDAVKLNEKYESDSTTKLNKIIYEIKSASPEMSTIYNSLNLPKEKVLKTPTARDDYNFIPNALKVRPISISKNMAYAKESTQNTLIPTFSYFPHTNLPPTRIYQANLFPKQTVQGTCLNTPNNFDNSKDTFESNLQLDKQKLSSHGFHTTSLPKKEKDKINFSINKNIIDLNNINIEDRTKTQTYLQPEMGILNLDARICPTDLIPKLHFIKQNLPEFSVQEGKIFPSPYNLKRIIHYDNKPNEFSNTLESSLGKKPSSYMDVFKSNKVDEIIPKENILEANENLRENDNMIKYQITPNKQDQQGYFNVFNNIPETKQNYLKTPSQLYNLEYIRPQTAAGYKYSKMVPVTSNIVPSSYLQHRGNPIPRHRKTLISYLPEYTPYSNINKVTPLALKPALLRNLIPEAIKKYITMNGDDKTASIPTFYENICSDIVSEKPQKNNYLKQSPNNLHFNLLASGNIENIVNDGDNTKMNKEYESSPVELNMGVCEIESSKPVISTSSSTLKQEEPLKTSTVYHHQYSNPSIVKMPIKHTNWATKFENYITPPELYKTQEIGVNIFKDYIPIGTKPKLIPKFTQTSLLNKTPSYIRSRQVSDSELNNFGYKSNIQRIVPFSTSPYVLYKTRQNTSDPKMSILANVKKLPPIAVNEDTSHQIYSIYYPNIGNRKTYKSNLLADVTGKPNVLFSNNSPQPELYYEEFNGDAILNIKQTPIAPVLLHTTPEHIIPNTKLPNFHPSSNFPLSPLTYEANTIPLQSADSSNLIKPVNSPERNNGYFLNLLYPKNIRSYLDPFPIKESSQNIVNPAIKDKYTEYTAGLDYFHSPYYFNKPKSIIPQTAIKKSFYNYITATEGIPMNAFATQSSYFTEYSPVPKLTSMVSLSTKRNINPITFDSFIQNSQNVIPYPSLTKSTKLSIYRPFIKRNHEPQNTNSNNNMITQNTGTFQSNAFSMLLPLTVCQTNLEAIPITQNRMSFINEIPVIRPLLDFSSEIKPHSSISNKTSSIFKPNFGLAKLEPSNSVQSGISFVPQINSDGYDINQNLFPVHYGKRYLSKTTPISIDIPTKSPKNVIPSRFEAPKPNNIYSQIFTQENVPPTFHSYKTIVTPQYTDFNYYLNHKVKLSDIPSNFETMPLPKLLPYIVPKSYKSLLGAVSPYNITDNRRQNIIYTRNAVPLQWNSLNIVSDNTLSSSVKLNTSPCSGIEYYLVQPPISTDFKASIAPTVITTQKYPLYDQYQTKWQIPSGNLNVGFQSQISMAKTKPYSDSPLGWYTYIKANQPKAIFNPEIQYPKPALIDKSSHNSIWNELKVYGGPCTSFPDQFSIQYRKSDPRRQSGIYTYDLKQYNPDSPLGSNILLPLPLIKQNPQDFKSEIKNYGQENVPESMPSAFDDSSNINKDLEGYQQNLNENLRYVYKSIPNIIIAKYEPLINSYVIKTDDSDVELKTWRSKLIIKQPRIVYDVKEVASLNFMPVIRNSKYTAEDAIKIAKNYITQKYGEPIVIKGVYSFWNPYAIINYNFDKIRNDMPLIWPTFCTCGCCKCGCNCRNK